MDLIKIDPAATPATVDQLAQKIAFNAPTLDDLTPAELQSLSNAVVMENLRDDLKHRVKLARINYQAERLTFLDQASRTKSPNTRRAYSAAMDRLDAWAARRGVAVLEMKPRDADDYAYSLATETRPQDGKPRSAASIRRDIAAGSSFFTFLERRCDDIRNPFRGTKARPEKRNAGECEYPDKKELTAIMAGIDNQAIRAAVAVMAWRGLRVGALPSLTIKGSHFTARSKGKDIDGELPPTVLEALKAAGLDSRKPFASLTEKDITNHIYYRIGQLHKAGKIRARYSPHDLRHYYAETEYKKKQDLYRLMKLLGHASVQVTEIYLRGLAII